MSNMFLMEIYIEERAKAKPRKCKLYKLSKVSLVKAKPRKRKIANLHRQHWSIVKVVKSSKKVVVTWQKVVVTQSDHYTAKKW